MPLLLKKRGQKVGSKLSVGNNLLLLHGHISNGNIKTHDLLHLELDGRLDLIDLLLHIVTRSEKGGELSSLGQTRTKKTGDLLDHVIGGQEEIILLGEFLNKLLVLVELLKIVHAHVINTDTIGLFAMGSVSEHAGLDVGPGDAGETEGSRETLVTLRIVVLESDLDLDRFSEVTLLSFHFDTSAGDGLAGGVGEDLIDGLVEEG